MSGIIKISDAASLGMHALACLAQVPTTLVNTKEIAQALNASEAHLAKVMQRLEHQDLVVSKRGPSGGFYIKQPAEQLSLLDIYEAIEGTIKSKLCILGESICTDCCPLGQLFNKFEHEIIDQLKATSLADFAVKADLKVNIKE